LRRTSLKAGIHEDFVVPIQADVVEIIAPVAAQSNLTQQNIAIHNGVRTAWLEVHWK